MWQISALLHKAGPLKPTGPAIPFLLDVFNLTIIVLTETDSLVVPRDQFCMSRAHLQAGLPAPRYGWPGIRVVSAALQTQGSGQSSQRESGGGYEGVQVLLQLAGGLHVMWGKLVVAET